MPVLFCKTTVRYHFTLVKRTLIKKKQKNKKQKITSFGEDVKKLEPCALLVECEMVESLQKEYGRFSKN